MTMKVQMRYTDNHTGEENGNGLDITSFVNLIDKDLPAKPQNVESYGYVVTAITRGIKTSKVFNVTVDSIKLDPGLVQFMAAAVYLSDIFDLLIKFAKETNSESATQSVQATAN